MTYHPLHIGPRVHAQCPTALEALRQQVPVEGPHADVVAIPPWEVLKWEGKTNHMGITTPQDRKEWVDDLYRSIPSSGALIISIIATVSNKGQYNDLMVGDVAAILNSSTGGSSRTWTWHQALGTEVTQYDVNFYALALGVQFLVEFFADQEPPNPSHTFTYLAAIKWLLLQSLKCKT